jgi:hypothetical protein
MSELWYYAEGNKPVGPLTLADMTAALSGMPNPANLLVWRDGLPSWVKAKDVPELARLVIKPPPIPVSATPPPGPVSDSPLLPIATQLSQSDGALQRGMGVSVQVEQKTELVGIGGWLVLLAIGQIIGPLRLLISLSQYLTSSGGGLWEKFPITFVGEVALTATYFAIVCYTTYLFFEKSRLFSKFFILECVAAIIYLPIDAIFTATTLSAYSGQPFETLTAKIVTPTVLGQWIASVLAAAIWMSYIRLSKRVRNTFVR